MKVHIDVDKNIEEPFITINCNSLDDKVINIQKVIQDVLLSNSHITFYKDNKEYYFDLDKVLFFETEGNMVYAHLKDDIYKVKYKLYELEKILPSEFIRISKSAILNTNLVYSIEKNITSYSLVEFYKSHKKVYVSRFYYKNLKHKLERRKKI